MTALDVAFRYGANPGPVVLRAIDSVREVYGIRRISFREAERVIRVEYDASRLTNEVVASLLRRAGLDLKEQLTFTENPAAAGAETR